MNRIIVIAFVCAASLLTLTRCTPSPTSPPEIAWTKALSIAGVALIRTDDEGFAVCGTQRDENGGGRMSIVRLDESGGVLWSQIYETNPGGSLSSLCQTSDGGFAAVGGTAAWAAQEDDVYLLRVDSMGNVLWERRFGGRGPDRGSSVREIDDGDLIVAGFTTSIGAGKSDFYLLRVAASGEPRWEKSFGAETWEGEYEFGPTVLPTPGGGFLLVGSTDSKSLIPEGAFVAVYVVQIDESGNKLWEKTYGTGGGFDVGSSVEQIPDGGFAIAGTRANKYRGLHLIRIGSTGKLLWEETYDAADAVGPVAFEVLADGGYILGNRALWRDGAHGYLLRTDGRGNRLWERRFGEDGYHRVVSLAQTSDGGVVALCEGADVFSYVVKLEPEPAGT